MKTIFIFALVALAAANDDLYDLEKIDSAALVSNVEEYKKFVNCFLNKGPCNEKYLSYKVHTPEAVKQACKRCSVEVKQLGNKFLETLKSNFPEDYALFKQVYDPEDKYFEALEIELNKYKNV